jgi:ABC-2 type transport system permease protein
MRKLLLIALHEYEKQVLKKRFLGALLAPLFFMGVVGVIVFVSVQTLADSDTGVVGYVDSNQVLAGAAQPNDTQIRFERFADEATAKASLERKDIVAYYVLAPDFATTGKADRFYWERDISDDVERSFEDYVRSAQMSKANPAIAKRLIDGEDLTFVTPDKSRAFGENNVSGFLLPIFFGILFFIALFAGAQYLVQAVVEEKENRTMELLISTVTPTQLMGGKILGLGGAGLTQVAVWVLAMAGAVAIASRNVPFMQGAKIEPGFIAIALIMFVLEYILFGSVMAAIGSTVIDQKQAQQYFGPFVLLAISPEFFIPVIFLDPNGPIATALSLFPFTAPLALIFRYGITTVPAWQIGLALALLLAFAVGALWLAGRVFRIGMLRYGQDVPLRELVRGVRG